MKELINIMTDAEQKLQEALLTTYYANLYFLSGYDKELYHRVDELSRMIEDGSYEEKYALEFIQGEGEFDIYDCVNDQYVYSKKPKKAIDQLVHNVQFDEKYAISTLEEIFQKNYLVDIKDDLRFNIEYLYESNLLTIKSMREYADITKDYLDNKKKRLKEVKKFIFLGVLTGRHIHRIAKKVNADIYLVCERNLELFRLSLFTVDYTILAKNNGVVFSIMDDLSTEEDKVTQFLYVQPYDSYLMKFSSTGINIDEYIDRILTTFIGMKPTSYDYNRYLYVYIKKATQLLKKHYPVLQMNLMRKNTHFFKDKKVLYIAGGPSFGENIEWIKSNQNKFYIVAVGAAYAKLLDNGIRVDMISTLDEQYHVLNETQFKDENVRKIPKDTIILASILTDQRLLDKFNTKNLFIYEVFKPFFEDNEAMTGFSVGEITLKLLLNMNVEELYLLGLDMALNQDTGHTHSVESQSKQYEFSGDKNREFFGLRDGLITIKGNLIDNVESTSLFYSSLRFVNLFLASKNENTNVYNLSYHGAYFNNTIPTRIDEIDTSNFDLLKSNQKDIFLSLKNSSKEEIKDTEKNYFLLQINVLEELLNVDIKKFEKIKMNTYDSFVNEVNKITNLIIEKGYQNDSVGSIINNYLMLVLPYLNHYFNDVKVKKEGKKVEEIQKVFVSQFKQIIIDYISFLKELTS